MSNLITYTHCPVCGSTAISNSITVTDYSVSNENFQLWDCADCTLRFTQHVPDQQSIGRYYQSENYISHTDTNKGIINRLYHSVRKITLKQKSSLIQSATGLNSGSLLDVGAGTGAFSAFMKSAGWRVTGLEPDEQARIVANKNHGLSLLSTNHLFELPAESFDAITMWHVLEHVHQLQTYIVQLRKLVKAGGKIFIAVPNYTSGDAEFYGKFWAAYDVPRHLYHFSPASMKQLLRHNELQLDSIKPMWFDSFYVSMLSEKYKTGKEGFVSGVFRGFQSNLRAATNKSVCSSLIYVISKS
ncbi:MAG: class I SAM-dependent methyltransferase [Chitinophagaceae bacterium]|nr:class I SAM-dependent methyltransferase [Chitinophagaceae bacterium]